MQRPQQRPHRCKNYAKMAYSYQIRCFDFDSHIKSWLSCIFSKIQYGSHFFVPEEFFFFKGYLKDKSYRVLAWDEPDILTPFPIQRNLNSVDRFRIPSTELNSVDNIKRQMKSYSVYNLPPTNDNTVILSKREHLAQKGRDWPFFVAYDLHSHQVASLVVKTFDNLSERTLAQNFLDLIAIYHVITHHLETRNTSYIFLLIVRAMPMKIHQLRMAKCWTAVSPVLMHCRYCSLALSHWCISDVSHQQLPYQVLIPYKLTHWPMVVH